MRRETKQTLLKQPNYNLQLVKSWDSHGEAQHAFVLYPTTHYRVGEEISGITLLTGKGHDASRRDMHYALYLFQRFHLQNSTAATAKLA